MWGCADRALPKPDAKVASRLVQLRVRGGTFWPEVDGSGSKAWIVNVRSVTVSGRLPESLPGPGRLLLRRWVPTDAEVLGRAVAESLEHLRPWMSWASQEPLSPSNRRAMIEKWEQEWLEGGDVTMGVFVDARVAGGVGLHRRIGVGGLEIGYWTHPAFLRMGLATTAAWVLTDAAFALPGIAHVEIHHDRANVASAGIPRKLGYCLVAQLTDQPDAPGEVGVECRWRMTREQWAAAKPENELPPAHAVAAQPLERSLSQRLSTEIAAARFGS